MKIGPFFELWIIPHASWAKGLYFPTAMFDFRNAGDILKSLFRISSFSLAPKFMTETGNQHWDFNLRKEPCLIPNACSHLKVVLSK